MFVCCLSRVDCKEFGRERDNILGLDYFESYAYGTSWPGEQRRDGQGNGSRAFESIS